MTRNKNKTKKQIIWFGELIANDEIAEKDECSYDSIVLNL